MHEFWLADTYRRFVEVLVFGIAGLATVVARESGADGLEVGITLSDRGSTVDDCEERDENEEANP